MRGEVAFCHAHSCLLSKAMAPDGATDSMGLLGDSQRLVTGPCWARALALWLVHRGWQVMQASLPIRGRLRSPIFFLVPGHLTGGWRAQIPKVTESEACVCTGPRVGGTYLESGSVSTAVLFLGPVHPLAVGHRTKPLFLGSSKGTLTV